MVRQSGEWKKREPAPEYSRFGDAVCVLSKEEAGLFEVRGRRVVIRWEYLHPDSIDRDGQRGRLIVDRAVALKLGL